MSDTPTALRLPRWQAPRGKSEDVRGKVSIYKPEQAGGYSRVNEASSAEGRPQFAARHVAKEGQVGTQASALAQRVTALTNTDEATHLSETAHEVAARLAAFSLWPTRVLRTGDGGLAFCFFGKHQLPGGAHNRFATIECSTPDGDTPTTVAMTVNRTTQTTEAREVNDDTELVAALNWIRQHLDE